MRENIMAPYRWKKALLLKRPKSWPLYEINIKGDGIEINTGGNSDFIAFKDIRILQLYKPTLSLYEFRIIPVNRKRTFLFSNIFAEGYKKFATQTEEFEKIVIAINKECVSCNPDARYIIGRRTTIIFSRFYRASLPFIAGLLLIFGIGNFIKHGNRASLYCAVSAVLLYFIERKEPKLSKQKSYDPHLLIKSGLKALSFYRKR